MIINKAAFTGVINHSPRVQQALGQASWGKQTSLWSVVFTLPKGNISHTRRRPLSGKVCGAQRGLCHKASQVSQASGICFISRRRAYVCLLNPNTVHSKNGRRALCEMTRRTQNLAMHPLGKKVRWRCWVGREASFLLFTAVPRASRMH